MVNRITTVYPCGLNKGFNLRFCVDFQVQHETLRIYQQKCCEYNNKNEVNSLNILSNNKYTKRSLVNNTGAKYCKTSREAISKKLI